MDVLISSTRSMVLITSYEHEVEVVKNLNFFLLYTFLTKQEVCAMKPSGIGGQAVIEGIMMRNKDKYSIAVRKPDHEIEVTVRDCKLLTEKHKWMGYPIIRGVVSFIDSLITGISTINYSASFYDDPEEQKITKADEIGKSLFKDKFESVLMAFTVILSVFMAVGLFMLLPYFVSRLVKGYVASKTLLKLYRRTCKSCYIYIVSAYYISYERYKKNIYVPWCRA